MAGLGRADAVEDGEAGLFPPAPEDVPRRGPALDASLEVRPNDHGRGKDQICAAIFVIALHLVEDLPQWT